jgi:hypothetical protein
MQATSPAQGDILPRCRSLVGDDHRSMPMVSGCIYEQPRSRLQGISNRGQNVSLVLFFLFVTFSDVFHR